MKSKLLFYCLIFVAHGLTGQDSELPEKIYVTYHIGFDTSWGTDGKIIRGGSARTEEVFYRLGPLKKLYHLEKISIKNELRPWEEDGFGANLRTDSLEIKKSVKMVRVKALYELISILDAIKPPKYDTIKTDNQLFLRFIRKQRLSNWTQKTFHLSKLNLLRLKKSQSLNLKGVSSDSILKKVVNHVLEENEGIIVSSVVEFIKISFEYQNVKYEFSHSTPGGMQLSWTVKKNELEYYLIAPELSQKISKMLPRSMSIKRELLDFKKFKTINNILRS